jgi:hypothetical protein
MTYAVNDLSVKADLAPAKSIAACRGQKIIEARMPYAYDEFAAAADVLHATGAARRRCKRIDRV